MTVSVSNGTSSITLNFLGHVMIREQPTRNTSGIRGAYSSQSVVVGDDLYSNTEFEMDLWVDSISEMETLINFLSGVTKVVAVDAGSTYERALAETGSIWRSTPIDHGYRKKRFSLKAIALYPYWTKVGSSGTQHYL